MSLTKEKIEYNRLQNNTWKLAMAKGQTLQGTVRCTWAPVFVPLTAQGVITRVFVFKQKPYTLIETAVETELQWMNTNAGIRSPWGIFTKIEGYDAKQGGIIKRSATYDSMLGNFWFYNERHLHVGRLTDAALELIVRVQAENYPELTQYLIDNPYVLYRPDRFSWGTEVVLPNGGKNIEPNPGNSEPEQRRTITLLLGLAASAALAMIN